MNIHEQHMLNSMLARLDEMERETDELVNVRGLAASRSLEDLPGKREPWHAMVSISLLNSEGTTVKNGTYTHSQSSIFVVESLSAAWRETSDAVYRPLSSVLDNKVATPVVDAIDFLWGIIEDDKFNWQTERLPSPLLFSNRERPFYLPVSGQITPNSTVKVEIEPIVAVDANGTLDFIFCGYRIMDPPPFAL